MDCTVAEDGIEPLKVDDMGEGVFVFSQPNDAGEIERTVVGLAMIDQIMDIATRRYGYAKNTDRAALQAA